MNTLIEILIDSNRKEDLIIEYSNGNLLTLKKDDNFRLTEDNWLIVNNKEYIKLDSIFNFCLLPAKEEVYAIIPTKKEVSKQILEILADNNERKTKEVKELLVENAITSKEAGKKFSKSKLKEKIDWICSFEISKLKKSGLIESKKWGYLNITSDGLNKIK